MLEMVQETMERNIDTAIAKIDMAIKEIDAFICKVIEEQKANEALFGLENENSSFGSKIEALRNFIEQLIEEREHLVRLSESSRLYGGGSMVCVTLDELAEQAAGLEETERIITADIERSYRLLHDTVDGNMTPETAQMFDVVAEYRTAAMELIKACQVSVKLLERVQAEYSACEKCVTFGCEDVSGKYENSRPTREEKRIPTAEVSSPLPTPAPYLAPTMASSVGREPTSRVRSKKSASKDEKKSGFLGLFKRKKQIKDTSEGKDVVPTPCIDDVQLSSMASRIAVPPPFACGAQFSAVELSQVPRVDSVQFSAVAPNNVVPGKYLPINILMYEDAFRKAVDEVIQEYGENAKESKSGYHDVERNSMVRVILTSRDVEIPDGEEVQRWNGKYLNFEFAVKIPCDFAEEQILLSAAVYINDIIATKLKLILDCEEKVDRNIRVTREDVVSAFVSYASQDRSRVAAIIQGMKKARPDMDIFFDIESLRSGQKWEEALKSEIQSRDILFLCWSRYARESKWVDMEWRYALASKGEDCIEPIPIDSPDICPPPIELQQKHFNDKMLYIIKATVSEVCGQPYLVRIRTQEYLVLDKSIVRIGKDGNCSDLTISGNAAISRSHACIISRDGCYYITDLNSKNHTYVDGCMIASYVETLLCHGSGIRLADEEFVFYC